VKEQKLWLLAVFEVDLIVCDLDMCFLLKIDLEN
jgi:hypothetical protein